MKSYHDERGNLVKGVSVLEAILSSKSKTNKLLSVLDRFEMRINTSADIGNTVVDWIVPTSW